VRKISKAEVAALVAALVVGTASADDGCEMTGQACPVALSTIEVNGFFIPPANFPLTDTWVLPGGEQVPVGTFPYTPNVAAQPVPTPELQEHVRKCVEQYGTYSVNPGYSITYVQAFNWLYLPVGPVNQLYVTTGTSTAPPTGSRWAGVFGITSASAPKIFVYERGFAYSTKDMFVTVAHEEGHAAGLGNSEADENKADSEAEAAYQRYLNDGGAKCGGLF
jgi:hypothetical protein